jgi:hypothetical protein
VFIPTRVIVKKEIIKVFHWISALKIYKGLESRTCPSMMLPGQKDYRCYRRTYQHKAQRQRKTTEVREGKGLGELQISMSGLEITLTPK